MNIFGKSRTVNTAINSFVGMLSYAFVMAATLATRVAFARYLGNELLGVNSLYTSILQVLQISELGISNAIIVFLYGPIKNSDKETIKSLISLYKRVYLLFSLFLFILGCLVDLFIIPHIVKVNSTSMPDIQIYFLLYLIGIVCSYLFAHNKSVIYAEQRNGVISWANAIQKCLVGIFQVLAVFLYKNYFLFLILLIVGNIAENLFCHFWVLKRHPYLLDKNVNPLSPEDKQNIINLIKPVFVVKIADKVLNQSDSIIVNSFIDIITLGMYANYHTIFNAVLGLFSPIGAALTSSYGNLSIGASPSEKFRGYKKSYDLLHFVSVLFCSFFLAYIQDFIAIAYGDEFLLSDSLCVWMTIYLYVTSVKTIYYSYQNAMGLHKLDQKQMLLQVPVNIIASIALVFILGIDGVVIGSIIALVLCSICFKGMYLYKFSFNENTSLYYIKTIKDSLLAAVILFITYFCSKIYIANSIISFLIKVIIMSIVICIYAVAILAFSKDFRTVLNVLYKKMKYTEH